MGDFTGEGKLMKNALFVVNYFDFMCSNVRDSFQDAAQRWNCDYIEMTEKIFPVVYHPGAVKLLAFDLCESDRIFVIDADAIIRENCPSPFDTFDDKSFVAVKNQQSHFPAMYLYVNPRIMREELKRIYERFPQIDFNIDTFFNTGVCLANRTLHKDILKRALDIFLVTPQLQWYDQAPLNYAVVESGTKVILADMIWNFQFPHPGNPDYSKIYIYHFAGLPSRYKILEKIDWRAI